MLTGSGQILCKLHNKIMYMYSVLPNIKTKPLPEKKYLKKHSLQYYFHLCLRLPIGLFPSGFPTKTFYKPVSTPYALRVLPISFSECYRSNNSRPASNQTTLLSLHMATTPHIHNRKHKLQLPLLTIKPKVYINMQ